MELISHIANDKRVNIFYDYFKNREDNEINNQLKKLSKDELYEMVLNSVYDDNSENALICRIYVAYMKGVKYKSELIKLANLYLTLYPQGKDTNIVLSKLAEAYMYVKNLKYNIECLADTDTFVVFDFETTGFDVQSDEIIEIGAVKVVKGKVVDKFYSLVKPYGKILNKSIKINGITNEMVKDAPEIRHAISEFKKFVDGYDLVGHNVVFDMRFLDVNLARIGQSISCKIYDTLKLSKKYFKGMKSYNLIELSNMLNMEHTQAHGALSDAETTAELYMKCFRKSNSMLFEEDNLNISD